MTMLSLSPDAGADEDVIAALPRAVGRIDLSYRS